MTRTERLDKPWTWLLAAAGFGLGLALIPLAAMPVRWVVAFAAAALAVPAVVLTGRPRRAALFLFAFSLQIGLSLYLTDPPPAPSAGASWPNSLALPVSSLTALGALALRRRRPFLWGGGIAAAALLLGLTTAISIPGSPARFVGLCHLVILAAYFLIFLAAANSIEDRRDLGLVKGALMASLALECVVYFIQTLTGATFTPAGDWVEPADAIGRYGGLVAARPAAFASFLLPLLLLTLAEFLTGRGRWRSALAGAMGGVTLALTLTRAAWIGFILGAAYLLLAGARRRLLVRRNVVVLMVILLAALLALSGRIAERARENHAADFDERWALAQMALKVIRAHPVTGVGAGAYGEVFRDYLTPDLADRWVFVVHNVYVLRAAETGLPGLAALVLFLWVAFRRASPERLRDPEFRVLALGWRAGLIALSWEMLWDISLGPPATSLLWFLCGMMTRLVWLDCRLDYRLDPELSAGT